MDQVQSRVQHAVNTMVNSLDQEFFRKMQAKMYRCSAACCENPGASMEDVQRCIDRCSEPINKGQQFMQNELSSLQDRLQRCAMDCQDKIRDKVGTNTTESDMIKYRKEMESCVVKCADTHIEMLPSLQKRMADVLKELK